MANTKTVNMSDSRISGRKLVYQGPGVYQSLLVPVKSPLGLALPSLFVTK